MKKFLLLNIFILFFLQSIAQNDFESEIKAFESEDSLAFPPKGQILMVGSSSIRLWNSYQTDFQGFNIIKRGVGGSQTSDAIYFCKRIITPYKPKQIFLYEGDNDLASGKNPPQVFTDLKQLIGMIRAELPDCQILYIAAKPSPSRLNLMPQQKELNQLMRNFCKKNKKMRYLDVFSPLLNLEGKPDEQYFIEDKLHLNAKGYAIWTKILRKEMKR